MHDVDDALANDGVAMYTFACLCLSRSFFKLYHSHNPTPSTMSPTLRYFFRGYFFPMRASMSMMGTGLQLLARTSMGKMT